MDIGIPKEIKNSELRVSLTESEVKQLCLDGHKVYVESGAGKGCLIFDEAYEKAGAKILSKAKEVYERSEMIVKVKEPLEKEYEYLKEDQILYTYLHLAAEPKLTDILCQKKVKAVAYETIQDKKGDLPLLIPMSRVAGRMATQVGAFYLQSNNGGKGVLLGGVTGTSKAKVCIIGCGVVGKNAAQMAMGLGAEVTLMDINLKRLEYVEDVFSGKVKTLFCDIKNLEEEVSQCDLLIGAVLLQGRKAPKLVTRKMIQSMPKGSVVVDVSVDQGGCVETCTITSHENPTFLVDGVIHYCVPNMPGAVPRTSTYALSSVTFPYARAIAQLGLEKALKKNPYLLKGLNTYKGYVTHESVAEDLNRECRSFF